jgi:hypothetical protein
MATKRLTPAERVQRLNEQHRLIQAALNYLSGLVRVESGEAGSESAAHFERMRTEARTHFEQGKLAVLQKYFRDVAAPSLVHDGAAFAAYIQQTTGFTLNVQSEFDQRIARVCKRKRIRTDAEFYDVRTKIDSLNLANEEQEAHLQLLYDLVAAYEGFLEVKDVGKARTSGRRTVSQPGAPAGSRTSTRKRERDGDFIEAEIGPAVYCYARLVDGSTFVFYDFTSSVPLDDVSVLAGKDFVFGLGVMLYATREGHWKIVGNAPIPDEIETLVDRPGFIRDGVHSPMTAEHALRTQFGISGFEDLNENVPWQGWAT